MSFFIEDVPEIKASDNNFIEVDTSHIVFLSDPPENTFILQTTPVNLQVLPVAHTTTVPKRKKRKKVELPPLYTCKICNYTTSRLQYFHQHQETHWVVKKNINEDIKNSSKNNAPINKNEKGVTEYKCPHCSYYTSNIRSLRIHMHIHSHGNAYRCLDCNFRGKNLQELITHHKRSKTMSCKYCTFSTHNKELFKTHKENNHAAKWFGCMRCNFAAADRGYLAKHITEHHSKAMRFDPLPPELDLRKETQT